jgi:hypothetical protein
MATMPQSAPDVDQPVYAQAILGVVLEDVH